MNTPPIIENMLAGLEGCPRAAFLRATEFAEPKEAEQFAWEVDRLLNGRMPIGWMVQRTEASERVCADVLAFILDRHWHYRFGNRKPPLWGLA